MSSDLTLDFVVPNPTIPPTTPPGGLTTETIASTVQRIYCLSYWNDDAEIGCAAWWGRSPSSGAGPGRRMSADGAWWQIFETSIDPRMLGARQSDRTTPSTSAVQEAVNLCLAGFYSDRTTQGGQRRVVFRGSKFPTTYSVLGGACMIDRSIVCGNGVEIEFSNCAEVCALASTASFNGWIVQSGDGVSSVLTVTSVPTRSGGGSAAGTPLLQIGATLAYSGVPAGLKLNRQLSATGSDLPGQRGTYELSQSLSTPVGSAGSPVAMTTPFWDSPYDAMFELPATASWDGNRFALSGLGTLNGNDVAPLGIELQAGQNATIGRRMQIQSCLLGGLWLGTYWSALTFTATPSDGDTVSIATTQGGTITSHTITFKTLSPSGPQVLIGANAAAAAANLAVYLVANGVSLRIDPASVKNTTDGSGNPVVTYYIARVTAPSATLLAGPGVVTKLKTTKTAANITVANSPAFPFQANIENLNIIAPFATTWDNRLRGGASSYLGIGLWYRNGTDNHVTASPMMITGYLTGYRDDGANNGVAGEVHVNTVGNSGNNLQWGPNVYPVYMNGSSIVVGTLYADTPTNMGDTIVITNSYGAYFGDLSNSCTLFSFAIFLNYDDLDNTSRYSTGITIGANNLNSADSSNAIYGFDVGTASSSIQLASLVGGAGAQTLVRQNVNAPSSIMLALGDIVNERPRIASAATASRRKNWLKNAAMNIWQRGTGDFTIIGQYTSYYGPDRWAQYSDASSYGTRSIRRGSVSIADATAANYQSQYILEIQQSGSPNGSYWHLCQRMGVDGLRALSGQTVTLSFANRTAAGTMPATYAGVGLQFGAGGSSALFKTVNFTPSGSTLKRTSITFTIPVIPSGTTIGTGPYLELFFNMSIAGAYTWQIGEVMLTLGLEQPIFDFPDVAFDLQDCLKYYEVLNTYTINGQLWIPTAVPMANVPTASVSGGSGASLGTPTVNGVLLSGSGITTAATVTFTASEP